MAKILIVDDDPDVVDVCKIVLEKEGHIVSSAINRSDGMKAVQDFNPELLILDIIMEQHDDGLIMAQDLRRQGFKAPILMLTSIGKVTGMNYGKDDSLVPVDDFVEKPVAPKTIIAKVNSLLKK